MHKREILRLYGVVKQQGYSLIPLSLYFKDSRVKVQVGLCRGKKLYDKRADMAEKAAKRDIERAHERAQPLTVSLRAMDRANPKGSLGCLCIRGCKGFDGEGEPW